MGQDGGVEQGNTVLRHLCHGRTHATSGRYFGPLTRMGTPNPVWIRRFVAAGDQTSRGAGNGRLLDGHSVRESVHTNEPHPIPRAPPSLPLPPSSASESRTLSNHRAVGLVHLELERHSRLRAAVSTPVDTDVSPRPLGPCSPADSDMAGVGPLLINRHVMACAGARAAERPGGYPSLPAGPQDRRPSP